MICKLCPRGCGVDRERALGHCMAPDIPRIARVSLHFWEEPVISGTSGSGTVFFSGCPLRCVYCQNREISRDGRYGAQMDENALAAVFQRLEKAGAHNINLVTPTHHAHTIVRALKKYKPRIPVIYNSSGYERVEMVDALRGLVDVYLPDMKYVDDALASRLSGVRDYAGIASSAIKAMRAQTGPAVFDENGMILRGTIVRHLVLPGHVKNSIGVLRWIKDELPPTPISVMSQYFPPCHLAYEELNRTLRQQERARVLQYMLKHGLTLGWIQDRESATDIYVPQFFDSNVIKL